MRQPKHLTHLGTPETGRTGSPSFYATDDGRYVVQGYKLTSANARAQLVNFPEGEDAIIVTPALIDLIVAHHTGTTGPAQ